VTLRTGEPACVPPRKARSGGSFREIGSAGCPHDATGETPSLGGADEEARAESHALGDRVPPGVPGPLVIMPTYREAANIARALHGVRTTIPLCTVLVVDDDGSDGTADLAERTGRQLGNIHVIRRPAKYGFASAYRIGFSWGLERGYQVIVGMDADLSHDPTALPRLLGALDDGADVAVGSRYVRGGSTVNWPMGRRALSRAGNWYAGVCLRSGLSDLTSAFRAYRADVLRSVDFAALRAEGYGFLIQLVHCLERSGVKFAEIPVQFINRVEGRSKMSPKMAVESFRVVTAMALSERRRPGPPGAARS
jgi:dolichol-phosphate mannosyltransferase